MNGGKKNRKINNKKKEDELKESKNNKDKNEDTKMDVDAKPEYIKKDESKKTTRRSRKTKQILK